MLYDIQDVLQINLPEKHKDMVTAYNTEWDIHNGQGWELKNLIELTKDRKSLFDVGGNVGFFSFVFCLNNNNDKMKRAYCFEPSPFGLSSAVEVLDHNDWFDRIKLFPLFIGDKNGAVEILVEDSKTFIALYEKPDKDHKIIDRGSRATGKLTTLDDFTWLAEMGKEEEEYGLDLIFEDKRKKINRDYPGFKKEFELDTLKIDVEGYEYKVLKGAEETIRKYKPLLFLEIHGHLLKLYNDTVFGVYNIVKDYGYTMFDIHMKEIKNKEQYAWLFNNRHEIRVVCKGD